MKSYTRIALIIGVIVIAALAVWKGMSRNKTDTVSQQIPALSMAPLASVSPVTLTYDSAGADWKTFSSASAGFSVAYPSDWTPGSCGEGCVGWAPPTAATGQFAVGVIRHPATTMEDLLKQAEQFLVSKDDVKAGVNTWTKLTLRQPTTGDIVTSHFIQQGKDLIEFGTATSDTDVLAIYGKMIASFKFLK